MNIARIALSSNPLGIFFFYFYSLFALWLIGSDTVLQVLTLTFQRLCEEIEPEELTLFWKCICEEITDSIKNECAMHLSNLLALLISTIQINEGRNVSGKQ